MNLARTLIKLFLPRFQTDGVLYGYKAGKIKQKL